MKLYYSKGSCSFVVRIILNELHMDCEYEAVDLKTKQTQTKKNFYSINPKGSVPVLELDGGEILTENAVILQYLADKAKANTLLAPIGEMKRYRTLEWLNYMTTELHKGFSVLFNPSVDQSLKDNVFIPLVKAKLSYVDHHLQGKNYLVEEQFTLPDAYLFLILRWVAHFKLDLKQWDNLFHFFNRLNRRESVQKSMKDDNE